MDTMTRSEVKRLIDLLPDGDLAAAARVLKGLLAAPDNGGARLWTLEDAPEGEPLTDDEREALREADEEERAGNPPLSHAEVKKRLGIL